MAKKPTRKDGYSAENITVLEGLDPVRKRPGMYIGSTSSQGLHHLIWEVVDNSIDEAMAGYADTVWIELLPDGMVAVRDNGRGIPVDTHKQTKKSALETIMTTLHAGGKFGGGGYKVSAGLHGVGVSVVNALSSYCKAEVFKDGKVYVQEYAIGVPKAKVKPTGTTKLKGTKITFKPDASIFSETEFDWKKILTRLRQQAYLTKGITIRIEDKRAEDSSQHQQYRFYFEGGIKAYVRSLNQYHSPKHPTIFYIEKELEKEEVKVEVALQYNDGFNEEVLAFANHVHNPEGGSHLAGFRTALTKTLNNYAREKKLIKEKDENLTGDDTKEGLTAVVSVKLTEPQFEGQTKGKLGNAEMKSYVEQVFGEALGIFLEEHPKEAEAIIAKCHLASQARIAARTARATILRKGALEGMTLPGKLADCSSRKAEDCELYIVEGDSAGGSAKQGRDRKFQAILPLRGKILNVERARLDKMLANNEIKNMVIALGTNIGDQLDLEKLRYHRIIIMTDADVDGAHIRTLLLTLFWRYFKPLVEGGYLYIAQPPLYQIKKNKTVHYAYTEKEKLSIIKELGGVVEEPDDEEASEQTESEDATEEVKTKSGSKISIQRYKGLGEMNPGQLWETTMDPENRILLQVTAEDAIAADETFEILMGSDVVPRRKFIQSRAKEVQNLDV